MKRRPRPGANRSASRPAKRPFPRPKTGSTAPKTRSGGRVNIRRSVTERVAGDAAIRDAAVAALAHGGRPGLEVDVILVSDRALAALHAQFLGDPSPTDVMAFDLGADADGPGAEIYVSVDCARRVARTRGVTAERELLLYVVHGALHLCGFDDHADADRKRMRAAEARVLGALGLPPDTGAHS